VSTTGYDDHVIFTVHNDGDPIPTEDQKQIFGLMRRGTTIDAERNMKKNLGLGLYIVREIIMAHHGDISVSSSEEKGTTFTVWLPKNVNTLAEK
jgi:signal transduction histidine kinase